MTDSGGSFDGLLPLYKPPGLSSRGVWRQISRNIGKYKCGHAGTLDPMAEGVLPLLLGKATKLQDLLVASEKEYVFDLAFGWQTDSLDRDGQCIRKSDSVPKKSEIENLIPSFLGPIVQLPNVFSAIKYQGRPLYWYARAGKSSEVNLDSLSRTVTIKELELLQFQNGVARLRVACSRGTYVRCLGRDIAIALGSCGTIVRLVRTRCGELWSEDCVKLPEVSSIGWLQRSLVPLCEMEIDARRIRVTPENQRKLAQGQVVKVGSDVIKDTAGFPVVELEGMRNIPLLLCSEDGHPFAVGVMEQENKCRSYLRVKRGL